LTLAQVPKQNRIEYECKKCESWRLLSCIGETILVTRKKIESAGNPFMKRWKDMP